MLSGMVDMIAGNSWEGLYLSIFGIIQYKNYMGNKIIEYNESHTICTGTHHSEREYNAVVYYHVNFPIHLHYLPLYNLIKVACWIK